MAASGTPDGQRQPRSATAVAGKTGPLLGIYINDHLAGSGLGGELAARAARRQAGTPAGAAMARVAEEISGERQALREILRNLGLPVREYKILVGWLLEKAARLKPNGHLVDRSPLSDLEELEIMRVAVEGKVCGFRTLRELAETDDRLDPDQLDGFIAQGRRQADTLEELRVDAVHQIFGPA
jgi:hypothetical protein